MSWTCPGTAGPGSSVLLKEVLPYLQRAWAGSSASASLVGRAAACDNVWLRSPGPGKPPKILSTPRCQQHLADSWDGWRGGAPLPATLQHTVCVWKNNNTMQPVCRGSVTQHLSLLPCKPSPVTQPGKTLVMDAAYIAIGWDSDNAALSAPQPRLVLVPGDWKWSSKGGNSCYIALYGGIFEIKAHSELRLNITPCALETWSKLSSFLN